MSAVGIRRPRFTISFQPVSRWHLALWTVQGFSNVTNFSGLPNLFWFIDREASLCGIYGGQVMPAGDAQTKEMIVLFEKTMYQRLSQHESGKLESSEIRTPQTQINEKIRVQDTALSRRILPGI